MYAYETIEMSLNYIEQHLNEKIETEKLAKIACLSTFYYQHLFKRLVKKSSPDEYRKSIPMLNTFDKPKLSSRYVMIDENVPLIVGNIVLEIQRKTLRTKETYFGFEKTVNIAEQIPAGESTGIDVPGQLWREFHAKKLQTENAIFNNDIELGVSHLASPDKGTFLYFAGGMVSSTDVCPKNMVQHTLPAGEYIVCKIEAESFEELVTTALNQANKYLFETWLPNHKLITKPFMAEKYYKGSADISYMEIWVIPVETGNAENELSNVNGKKAENLSQY